MGLLKRTNRRDRSTRHEGNRFNRSRLTSGRHNEPVFEMTVCFTSKSNAIIEFARLFKDKLGLFLGSHGFHWARSQPRMMAASTRYQAGPKRFRGADEQSNTSVECSSSTLATRWISSLSTHFSFSLLHNEILTSLLYSVQYIFFTGRLVP